MRHSAEPRLLRLPGLLALLVAALGGFALDAATPSLGWWPMGLLGAVLVFAALWHQRPGLGAVIGAVAGAAFWMPHISWLTLYLGPVPWLGLSGVMIAWFALFGMGVALATRGLALFWEVRRWPAWLRVAAQALTAAGIWVLREQVQSTWPYGGFAWGRLVHTQSDGPLLSLVSWLGFSGLSGLLALLCAIPVAWFFAPRVGAVRAERGRGGGAMLRGVLRPVGLIAAFLLLMMVPPAPVQQTGTLRVAAVQGDSKSGIFDDRENGDVFQAHYDATVRLLDSLEAKGERVDVIVWPENSAEFDLPNQFRRSLAVRDLAERAGAPIVVGSVLKNPDGSYTNSTLVYGPDGDTGLRYDKRRPVPFAEYMPDRPFFHALAPELVDLVQLEYRAGTRPAVLEIPGASGPFAAGIAICFDIVFDDHAVAMMNPPASGSSKGQPAQVIFAQTNNADFGHTDESAQQLAIARMRAVETGRALVNISTVGTSAIVLPDGRETDRLTPFTAASM
ncbi:MAG: apolipoprotein N-acyltransferase, partial [Actinobacteria bacterium]|nr:apolipoprotein N-acyltransferase [Actinomycetota bacterium]